MLLGYDLTIRFKNLLINYAIITLSVLISSIFFENRDWNC